MTRYISYLIVFVTCKTNDTIQPKKKEREREEIRGAEKNEEELGTLSTMRKTL